MAEPGSSPFCSLRSSPSFLAGLHGPPSRRPTFVEANPPHFITPNNRHLGTLHPGDHKEVAW
eukprot:9206756-Pyramimonas_sp.AAC.1